MASKILLLRGVLTVLFVTTTCLGFNIDERFPVIKEGKTAGRLFGFSVALHYQTQGTKQYLLLVGAPKEKAVLQLNDVEETGAIYSCPITTDTSDCSRMDLVSSTDDSEMVEGMWLGVTVASQQEIHGGRVLACGHRYIKVVGGAPEEHRRMVGKCYVRGNDLTYDPRDGWQTYNYEVCNSNYNEKSEGLCSMGLAAGFTETDVYIGTVGSYTWQGNVHITWRDPDLDIPLNTDFGELTNRNIYMGYSVHEDKNMLSRSEDTVVTGSPRDESRGSVTLARKDSKLVPVLVIPGEQVGSYFGNSLAVTDLNNDDWNDLIVGAPFYFDRKEEKGGAVYVYMNENGSFQNSPTLVLKGPKDSGFGFAVAAIGDINQDGFQDIAVGAPFYESGEVYIWMGSGKGLSGDASQVIKGQTVNSGFKTFGYSINGGIDMDENRYPDIVVGSLDDCVALLRARPVIHISKNFTVQPKIVDPKLCPPNDKPCITVTVCFSYTLSTGNKDLKKDVTVNYTVKADVNRRSTRVRFLANQEDSYSDLVILPSPEAVCSVLQLIVKENVRDKLEAVVFSLSMALHENKPKSRRSLQNLDSYPILSPKEKVTERTEINFQKECGTDNKCSSNLQLTAKFANEDKNPYPSKGNRQVLQYSSDVKKVLLLVEVTNFPSHGKVAEDAHQAMLNITIPSTLRYAGVRSEEPDVECSAEETVLCELGNPLKSNEKVLLRIKFETSGVTLYTQEIESWLKLSTLSEQNDLLPVPVVMLIENTILTSFSIEQPQVLTQFSGEVMGESAMNTTSDVGSPVEYTYKVKVLGQPLGNMGSLALEFEWPFEVTNGKWLLYLTEIVTKGTAESRCVPPGDVVNVLNLTLSNTRSKRPKREVEEETIQPLIIEPQATITGLTPRKESFLLDCSLNTARCVTFTCPLTNMSQSAEVIVRSRVWNSTMLEDYANSLRVTVKGKVTLKLITDKPTIKMNDETREFGVNIDPVLGEETPYEVPLWIIIVAAVAGILVLGVISLILWKLGFFRRAIYYRIMPKYHGVKIRREERYQLEYQFNMGFMPEDPQKKYWITNWTEMQQYYY